VKLYYFYQFSTTHFSFLLLNSHIKKHHIFFANQSPINGVVVFWCEYKKIETISLNHKIVITVSGRVFQHQNQPANDIDSLMYNILAYQEKQDSDWDWDSFCIYIDRTENGALLKSTLSPSGNSRRILLWKMMSCGSLMRHFFPSSNKQNKR
jgi:hypothetical protein